MTAIAKLEAEIIRRAEAHADRETANMAGGPNYNEEFSTIFAAECERLGAELLTPAQRADLAVRNEHAADLSSASVDSGGWRA